ncbi:MAG TPA: PDR/VanB family oxidoreductase [Rhodocyclaceae bacterium]|nr:PDR/VanB family oxidoreductase [Rhodocyclaceae bacterium]
MILVRVRDVRVEAEDIRSIDLVSADGSMLPAWTPGAHIEVQLPGGLMRPYSLFNGPEETDCYRIAIKRDPASRGGSAVLHESVARGDNLHISAPRNLFQLDLQAKRFVLIAGGIGITPIFSMFRALIAADRDVTLHYFARGAAHAAFADTLFEHSATRQVNCHFGLDEAATRARLHEILGDHAVAMGDALYICGPTPLMELVTTQAHSTGWPEAAIHRESFGAIAVSPKQHDAEKSFEVVFARSGKRCVVAPGQTIIAAAAEVGIVFDTSCEQGFCGCCLSRVLEGEPEHRDGYLSKAEQAAGDQIMPCISRCKSARLVLDI